MDADHEEMLAEMGLSPIWRMRASAAHATAVPIATSMPTAVPIGTLVPESAIPTSEPVARGSPPASPVDGAPPHSDALRTQSIATLEWDPLIAHIAECTACGLCRTRKNTVPGVGSASAGWMFVGEAPGAEEDVQGEPFVGQAGRLLDNMLKAIGLERSEDVFIANVLKCRPPNNRNPEPGEVAKCAPYLERQLELIRPRLIIALGRFAAMTLLDTEASIASLRGRVHQYRGVPLIVTYHPAYLLRALPEKAKAWEDLLFARRTFARLQNQDAPQS